MKKLLSFSWAILLAIPLYSQVQYLSIEPNHSTIGFEVPIAGGATLVTGKFMEFDLQLSYVNKDWTKSKVNFSIQTESINTGITDRDKHLKSADFFEVETYPQITFVSDLIRRTGDATYVAEGTFSMHGISKPMSLPFTVTYEEGNTIGVNISTTVNRIAHKVGEGFKHTHIENFIGDEILVKINFWTRKDKRKETAPTQP